VTARRVVLRELATRDVDAAIEHYLDEASEEVALGFVEAVQRAFDESS
jgi:toxin ParE1/3/4